MSTFTRRAWRHDRVSCSIIRSLSKFPTYSQYSLIPCFPRKMALYKPGSSSKQVPRPSGVTEFEILKASHKYVSKRPEPNHIIILSFFENIDSCERTKMIVNFHGMINLQRNIIQVSIVSSQFATSSITNQAR